MPSTNWTKITIGLFAALIFCTSFFTGQSIDQNGLKWISSASSGVILLLLVFDKWVWRWPLVRKLSELLGHPIIYGTWKGQIEFDADADGGSGTSDCYLSIYQTFSSVEVRGYFSSSNSYSITAIIDHPRPTQTRLTYVYHGDAPYGKRNTNRPHEGTAILDVVGRPVQSISGSYFTERGGSGQIKLNKHSKKLSESLAQASNQNFEK